jgi:hypothetical protein
VLKLFVFFDGKKAYLDPLRQKLVLQSTRPRLGPRICSNESQQGTRANRMMMRKQASKHLSVVPEDDL